MISLNSEGNEVEVNGLVIKLKQNIDYRDKSKVTVGRIDGFKNVYHDPFDLSKGVASVWMYITEIECPKNKNWISISNWYEDFKKGLFENLKKEQEIHDNTEPSEDDVPF